MKVHGADYSVYCGEEWKEIVLPSRTETTLCLSLVRACRHHLSSVHP